MNRTATRALPQRAGSRREFFSAAARGGLLALLAAGTAMGLRRRGTGCGRGGLCRGCDQMAWCGRPEALSVRSGTPGG